MPTRLTAITLVLLFLFHPLTSWSSPFPGYYVTKQGDSVLCAFENFKDWRINPLAIQVTVNGQSRTLAPLDINAFGISRYSDYLSATVSYYTGTTSIDNAPEKFSDERETKPVFLKIVADGKYSLYELKTAARVYYFIKDGTEDAPVELIYRMKRVSMSIEEDTRFRNTLFAYFSKEGMATDYVKMISNASYANGDVARLINILNRKSGSVVKTRAKGLSFQGDVYAGATMFMFPIGLDGNYVSDMKLKSSLSPAFGVNAMYLVPGRFKSLAIGVSLGYTSYSSSQRKTGEDSTIKSRYWRYVTRYDCKMSVSNSLVQMNLYGQYIFNPLSSVKLFAKLGLNGNFSLASSRDVSYEYTINTSGVKNGNEPYSDVDRGSGSLISTSGMYYDINTSLGLSTGRHRFEATYYAPVYLDGMHKMKISAVGCRYYFAVFR